MLDTPHPGRKMKRDGMAGAFSDLQAQDGEPCCAIGPKPCFGIDTFHAAGLNEGVGDGRCFPAAF